jgi:hypothetical protein
MATDPAAAWERETATERGDRIEREAVNAARPILRRQFALALGMIGRKARDEAAGVAPMLARSEATSQGLDRRIAEYASEVAP